MKNEWICRSLWAQLKHFIKWHTADCYGENLDFLWPLGFYEHHQFTDNSMLWQNIVFHFLFRLICLQRNILRNPSPLLLRWAALTSVQFHFSLPPFLFLLHKSLKRDSISSISPFVSVRCIRVVILPFQLHHYSVSGQSGLWAESIWGWAGLGDSGPGAETFPEEAASRPGWGTEPPSWLSVLKHSLPRSLPTPPLPLPLPLAPSMKILVKPSLLASFDHVCCLSSGWEPWSCLSALHLDWFALIITCLQVPPTQSDNCRFGCQKNEEILQSVSLKSHSLIMLHNAYSQYSGCLTIWCSGLIQFASKAAAQTDHECFFFLFFYPEEDRTLGISCSPGSGQHLYFFSELLWELLWAVRYNLLQEANCFLTLTLLSGDQRPESSNRSTDCRIYEVQVRDNTHDVHSIQWVIMTVLLTTVISLVSICLVCCWGCFSVIYTYLKQGFTTIWIWMVCASCCPPRIVL